MKKAMPKVKTITGNSEITSHFLLSRTHTFTEENEQTLKQLSQDASDALGRPVSSSALLRAMLAYIKQQTPAWTAKQLHPLIEKEIEQGRVWGSKKKP